MNKDVGKSTIHREADTPRKVRSLVLWSVRYYLQSTRGAEPEGDSCNSFYSLGKDICNTAVVIITVALQSSRSSLPCLDTRHVALSQFDVHENSSPEMRFHTNPPIHFYPFLISWFKGWLLSWVGKCFQEQWRARGGPEPIGPCVWCTGWRHLDWSVLCSCWQGQAAPRVISRDVPAICPWNRLHLNLQI